MHPIRNLSLLLIIIITTISCNKEKQIIESISKEEEFKFKTYSEDLYGAPYGDWGMEIDNLNNIWIIPEDSYLTKGGINKFNGNTWVNLGKENLKVANHTICQGVICDKKNQIWTSIEDNIYMYNGIVWSTYKIPSNLRVAGPYTYVQYCDDLNNIWISQNNTLLKFDGSDWSKYNVRGGGGLVIDNKNNLWACEDGIRIIKNSNKDSIEVISSIIAKQNSADSLKWITITNFSGANPFFNKLSNELYISLSNGLLKFDGESWYYYTKENSGLPNKDVMSIAFDNKNNLWVGTYKGIARLEGNKFIQYKTPCYTGGDIGFSDRCHKIMKDTKGDLWFSMYQAGLVKLEFN